MTCTIENRALEIKNVHEQFDNFDFIAKCTKNSSRFLRDNLNTVLPTIVVVGAQSVGKSSVIRRLLGVELPIDATLCTRMPIQIQVRNESVHEFSVKVESKNAEKIFERKSERTDELGIWVKEAQDLAVEKSGTQFVKDFELTVRAEMQNAVNITMIDLPGWHSAQNKEMVEEMVKEYLSAENCIVVHVMKGNNDYDGTLGNNLLRQDRKGGISARGGVTIVTHLDKSSREASELEDFVEKALQDTTCVVAVKGNAESDEEEREALEALCSSGINMEVGRKVAMQRIVDLFIKAQEDALPDFSREIMELERRNNERLQEIKEKVPADVFAHYMRKGIEFFDKEKLNRDNECREILENMQGRIKEYRIQPVMSDGQEYGRGDMMMLDNFSDVGDIVYVRTLQKTLKKGLIKENLEDGCIVQFEDGSENKCADENVYACEMVKEGTMIKDIQRMLKNRGFIIESMVNKQDIVARYAAKFADFNAEIMREGLVEMRELLIKQLETILDQDAQESLIRIKKNLKSKMRDEIEEIEIKTEEAIADLHEHHSSVDAVFSLDQHYFNDLETKMIMADEEAATDQGGCRKIMHSVRAWIKVERKKILGHMEFEFMRYIRRVAKSFKKMLEVDSCGYLHLFDAEDRYAIERSHRMQDKEKLDAILKAIKKISRRS